jgi:hypothetical protein
VNITAKPIELRDTDRALELAGLGKGGLQLGTPIERVRTLACLDFNELPDNLETLCLSEPGNGFTLSGDTKA